MLRGLLPQPGNATWDEMTPFLLSSSKVISVLQIFEGTDAAAAMGFGRISVGCFLRRRYVSPLWPLAICIDRVGHSEPLMSHCCYDMAVND